MNNRLSIFLIGSIIILSQLLGTASAQDLPGKRDSINSVILKEKRIIQVLLPEKYKPGSTDKYDVLYVLDGDWNTKLALEIQHFIESEAYMPPTIIVGVLNVDRDRDLTPTHVDNPKTSGGADKFLSFLKNELIPYVDKTYPSNGDNTLFGHSYGGLFVMYALLNEPNVFKSYIAADPSFWWDKHYMNKQATDKLPGLANMHRTLYMTGREGEGLVGMGIPPMDTILRKYAPADLIWKLTAYPEETHGSVRLKSMYDGLKFSYAGYGTKGAEFHPMSGILLKDKPIKIWNFSDASKAHYTIDGTEPMLTSAKMAPEITLSGPATVKAKLFSNRDRYNKTTTGEFKAGTFLRARSTTKNMKPGGFHYAYYEGDWDKLPDFEKLKPVQSGITDKNFDINKFPRQNNFGLVIDGQIEIREEGYYIFGLSSDDGSKLYFDNQLVMDNDGLHGNDVNKSYILPLRKGFYPIRLEYFQKDGGRDLKLIYLTPTIMNSKNPIPIPLELQYGAN